ncbi:hypothetical protein D3C81_601780 [compost metagenome]
MDADTEILKNNFWHIENESNTVFVFVHGFFSDSRKCWKSTNGVYWPDLLLNDNRFESPSIYMAGFFTDVDSKNYAISDCANEVFDALKLPSFENKDPVLKRKNLVFVCHSLGGIVVRYMLENNREAFLDKNIGLALIASPSFGSDYATSLRSIALFYKNKIGIQLQKANDSLEDLDNRFKNLLEKKIIKNIVGSEAIEHNFIINLKWLPGFSPVVKKESAARYFGGSKTLAGTNHSTCVKPDSHLHVSHIFLVSFYLNKYIHIKSNELFISSEKNCGNLLIAKPSALFEIYHSQDEPYFVCRAVDDVIQENLKYFSLWTFGISGSGKTSSVRRRTFLDSNGAIQIYIGSSVDQTGTNKEILVDIYYGVIGVLGKEAKEVKNESQLIFELSTLLSSHSYKAEIVLVIDEVPFLNNPKEMSAFVKSMSELIILTKQKASRNNIKIIITSIFDPRVYFGVNSEKINEHIACMDFNLWDIDDINILITTIEAAFPLLKLSDGEKSRVIESAKGSPRYIKSFYRNYKIGIISKSTFLEAIAITDNNSMVI